MEVTLLVQATDDAFKMIEDARHQAIGILDTAVGLTSETRDIQKRNIQAIFRGAQESRTKFQNFIGTFLLLSVFWLLLSGKFDAFHLTLGGICCLIVSLLTYDLLFTNIRIGDYRLVTGRFLSYVPWLIYQIILSNIHVAALALKYKLPVDPQVMKFKTKLETDISWVTLANSITLTPGTITMDIKDGEFYIHALDQKVAEDLDTGEMENRIAHIFMEADHIYVQDVLDVARIYGAIR